MTPSRPHCVTENTGHTVELAQLGNAFLDELLPTMLLNHVQHEAVARGSSEGCSIWTTLSKTKVFLLLLSRPVWVGLREWCIGGAVGAGRAVSVAGRI